MALLLLSYSITMLVLFNILLLSFITSFWEDQHSWFIYFVSCRYYSFLLLLLVLLLLHNGPYEWQGVCICTARRVFPHVCLYFLTLTTFLLRVCLCLQVCCFMCQHFCFVLCHKEKAESTCLAIGWNVLNQFCVCVCVCLSTFFSHTPHLLCFTE